MNFCSDPETYLLERTHVGEEDVCWPWKLSVGSHGYGQGWDGIETRTAHSMWWEYWSGGERWFMESSMTIDHECHNRVCCNPNHLRILPNVENATDNGHKGKTHCKRGHEYTPDNTRNMRSPSGGPGRACKRCDTLLQRERRARAKTRS